MIEILVESKEKKTEKITKIKRKIYIVHGCYIQNMFRKKSE